MQHLIKKIEWDYSTTLITGRLTDEKSAASITIDIQHTDFKLFELTAYMYNGVPFIILYHCRERVENTPEEPLKEDFWNKKVIPCFKTAIEKSIMEWKLHTKEKNEIHN